MKFRSVWSVWPYFDEKTAELWIQHFSPPHEGQVAQTPGPAKLHVETSQVSGHTVFTMCSPCSQWGSGVDSTVKIVRLLWNIHNHSLQEQNLNGHCQDIAGLWFSTAGYTKQQAHAKTIQNQQVRPAREMPGRCQLPRKLATHILSIGKASLPQSPEAGEAGEALRTFTSNIIHDYTLFNTYPIDIQQIITQHLFNTADCRLRRNSIAASRGLKMFEDVWSRACLLSEEVE